MTVETNSVDPEVGRPARTQRFLTARDLPVVAAAAAGGIAGAEARYALGRAVPLATGAWPAATFAINVSGCLLIGALMVVLTELTSPHRLARPFLGVGVLGGWTTFSTAMVEVVALARAGHGPLALGYLAGTLLAALLATAVGVALARSAAAGYRRLRVRRAAR